MLISHIWFLVVYTLCFIVPFHAGFIIYFDLLLTTSTFLGIFTVFSSASQKTLWKDYVWPFITWYLSVTLYLFVRAVQSQLMFFLADVRVVMKMDE